VNREFEREQALHHLLAHRPGIDVAPDHDLINPGSVNLGQHRLERRQISVDVIQRRDAHRFPVPSASQASS
jgi:hypothetical protein